VRNLLTQAKPGSATRLWFLAKLLRIQDLRSRILREEYSCEFCVAGYPFFGSFCKDGINWSALPDLNSSPTRDQNSTVLDHFGDV
jgi:hypothetical protein